MTMESTEPVSAWAAADDDLIVTLEQLRRALRVKDADLQSTLHAVAAEAVRTIPGAAFAGVNLLVHGEFVPKATVGIPPGELDAFQLATGLGPCVDASRDQATIYALAMGTEDRWNEFAPIAVRLGVRSMLCVPLWVDDTQLGSLSLYGVTDGAFEARDEAIARLFALHAAIAIGDAQRVDNLKAALRSRDVIGQAKGILMERRRLTADQAFAILAQVSQSTNRKLVDIAETFVLTGELS